ncbi:hypothetical protein PR048_006121 [Dryococelus australis]|uniref:Phosphotransferase n=1 Tax=Dryococelus australis TaxID=614101 RepID=A0ABQ9IA33_9NEOP|nr:hypothetical protein PR048_006121 [Dryococelus australis]
MCGGTGGIDVLCETGNLVRQILEHMRMKIEGSLKPDRELFAYGGQDTILLALLAAMNVWDGDFPRFPSCLLLNCGSANTMSTSPR